MTTPKTIHVEILTTLEEDPKMRFFPWELNVRNAAAALCKTITPRGLLSVVLEDDQWQAYPTNITSDAHGTLVIANRYTPPVHVDVNGTMSSAELYVAKASNDELLQWVTHEEALKNAIVKSLGLVIRQIMQHPVHGFTLMSIRDILAKVRAKYGRMRTDTRKGLNELMTTRLSGTDNFDTHVSNLRELFTISTAGGHLVPEDERVEIFKESLLGHPIIAQAVSQYDFLHPDETTQTFEDLVSYLDDHLPNLRHASQISERATAQVMASEAYLSLEAENKKLKAANDNKRKDRKGKGNGKGNGKGKGKPKKQRKNRSSGDKDKSTDKPLLYCHAHGSQPSHSSRDCKLMAANTTQFTAAMRNAKDATHPPGGSTKVLGQEAQ